MAAAPAPSAPSARSWPADVGGSRDVCDVRAWLSSWPSWVVEAGNRCPPIPGRDHDGYRSILRAFRATGSHAGVEDMIPDRQRQARQVLSERPFEPSALATPHALAQSATERL